MDYVAPGRVIQLAGGQALVIGYVASCLRETIVGGVVTVGTQRSEVSLTGSWGVGGQGCSLVATRIGD